MRISTALLSTLVAGSSLSLSMQYAISQQELSSTLGMGDLDVGVATPNLLPKPIETSSSEPAPVESSTQTPQASPEQTETLGEPTTPTEVPAPSPEPEAAQSAQQTPQITETTVVSDVINYKYGVVQVSITALASDITGVELLQGDASYGRDVAYEALINATIQTDGTNYGNVSGATFTTDAFKKAISNALGKL